MSEPVVIDIMAEMRSAGMRAGQKTTHWQRIFNARLLALRQRIRTEKLEFILIMANLEITEAEADRQLKYWTDFFSS